MNEQDLIYHELILELNRHPLNKKKLEDFTYHHKEFNPLCGDEVELFVKTDEHDMIIDIGFQGQGCALSQASASILTEMSKKKTLPEAQKITTEEILKKLGLEKLNPTRLRCVGISVENIHKISTTKAAVQKKSPSSKEGVGGVIEDEQIIPNLFNRKYLKPFRKKLRNNLTKSETILWKHLSHDQLGVRFRRQYSIGDYIVDFYCPTLQLVIEVDGSTHFEEQVFDRDQKKESYLKNLGIVVKRYPDEEVFNNLEQVITDIYQTCEMLKHQRRNSS